MAATHCPDCRKKYSPKKPWCKCDFPKVFGQWTSGDNAIDEFIKMTQNQLGADYDDNFLEWIPFDRFRNKEIIGQGGYGTVYCAEWIDGKRSWDLSTDPSTRTRQPCKVALKSLNSEMESHQMFLDEVRSHYDTHNTSWVTTFPMYGLSRDPDTQVYLIVMPFIENGNLRTYVHKNFHAINWEFKLQLLYSIALRLFQVHNKNMIHRDLHGGNVLVKIDKDEKRPATWELRNFFSNRRATQSVPQEYRTADERKESIVLTRSHHVHHTDAIYTSRLWDIKKQDSEERIVLQEYLGENAKNNDDSNQDSETSNEGTDGDSKRKIQHVAGKGIKEQLKNFATLEIGKAILARHITEYDVEEEVAWVD
ncbi:985_t:CDS:2 [Ambispora gerdemannii]|uniref:985_t:CDS:1 n=1 Tax=Ambispora gerdemannii TaxID=144530 RepID=A0A9N9ARH8_9GLOM|nr:985_t:CDS:2 [Ambispora gerdemannii]